MGWNATVVVMTDALHEIERDTDFGRKLASAISMLNVNSRPQHVSAGCHGNAASAIELHHADHHAIVAVGGNMGTVLGHAHCDQDQKLAIIKQLAESMGYSLRKKAKR